MADGGTAPCWLVIGYGNDLRSDDGVAHEVVRRIEGLRLKGVVCKTCHQLTPELADLIKDFPHVVFVDAMQAAQCGTVHVSRLESEGLSQVSDVHASSPQYLVRLACELYQARPQAWMITIPAIKFDFGEKFSPIALEGCALAVEKVVDLWHG